MAIKSLTVEQHQQVLDRLVKLARAVNGAPFHAAGPEYTSLMVCFLMHSISAAEAVLRLRDSFGNDWFPSTVGYAIVRAMFEIDVAGHYISLSPANRSKQYIEFESVLDKRYMDACSKHRTSKHDQWREAMDTIWREVWARREQEVNRKYTSVKCAKNSPNWSGKKLRQMAIEVDHEEAYDVFYAELSSFTHVDVRLANRFLRISPGQLSWSQRAREFDVGNVLRYAAIFLTCFLELFARQFNTWTTDDISACWDTKEVSYW